MKAQFTNDDGAFINAGTSEGALKGWDTRRSGAPGTNGRRAMEATQAAHDKEQEKPKLKQDHHDHAVMAHHHEVASDLHRKAAEDAQYEGDHASAQEHRLHSRAHSLLASEHKRLAEIKRPVSPAERAKAANKADVRPLPEGTGRKFDTQRPSIVEKHAWDEKHAHGERGGHGRMGGMGRMGGGGYGGSRATARKKKKKHGQQEEES